MVLVYHHEKRRGQCLSTLLQNKGACRNISVNARSNEVSEVNELICSGLLAVDLNQASGSYISLRSH